jgi:hypothetical protein
MAVLIAMRGMRGSGKWEVGGAGERDRGYPSLEVDREFDECKKNRGMLLISFDKIIVLLTLGELFILI